MVNKESSVSIFSSRPPLKVVLINTWSIVNAKGGTEKVFCDMANALAQRGHHVTAICVDKNEGLPGFPIDRRVRFINAYYSTRLPFLLTKPIINLRSISIFPEKRRSKRADLSANALAYQLNQVLSNLASPDVLISFQPTTTYAIKKLVGKAVPLVTMLHTKPTVFLSHTLPSAIKSAVASSSIVQVLRPEFIADVHAIIPSANIKVIPNAVPQFQASSSLKNKIIINIARITEDKGQLLLVEAFAKLKEKFPEWNIELWGETHVDPKYTEKVKSAINSRGLTNHVRLCGTTDDVSSQLKRASIFAFPSRHEGFPLALTEAMSMGLPAIGWVKCTSVNTLIKDGDNGLLCEDTPESLANALSRLMMDESVRIRLGNTAKEDMKEYAPSQVWAQWEKLLLSLSDSHQQ